jgi:hypothetical protein
MPEQDHDIHYYRKNSESRKSKNIKWGRRALIAGAVAVFWYGVGTQEKIEATAPASAIEIEVEGIGDAGVKLPAHEAEDVYCGEVRTTPPIPFLVHKKNPREIREVSNGMAEVVCKGVYGIINIEEQ